jgi:hypothetical protein
VWHPARRRLILVVRTINKHMSNPYQTPDSEVLSAIPNPERPSTIKLACICVLGTILINFISLYVFGAIDNVGPEFVVAASFTYIIIFGSLALIYNGRNWARILFLLYMVAELIHRTWFIIVTWDSSIVGVTTLIFAVLALDVATVYFLLHKRSATWYSQMKNYRAR